MLVDAGDVVMIVVVGLLLGDVVVVVEVVGVAEAVPLVFLSTISDFHFDEQRDKGDALLTKTADVDPAGTAVTQVPATLPEPEYAPTRPV